MEERLLTVDEVPQYLRVKPLTMYRLLERGEIRGTKIGRLWRIAVGDLKVWTKQQTRSQLQHNALAF